MQGDVAPRVNCIGKSIGITWILLYHCYFSVKLTFQGVMVQFTESVQTLDCTTDTCITCTPARGVIMVSTFHFIHCTFQILISTWSINGQ